MDPEHIRKALLTRYVIVLVPAALVFAGWAAVRNLGAPPDPIAPDVMGPASFICAIVAAIALPLFYRDRFVKSVAAQKAVEPAPFLAFEKTQLTLALLSAYCAAAAYVCTVNLFHFGGSFLAALYAAYYHFPSQARVAQEMRLFRVGQAPAENSPKQKGKKRKKGSKG